MAIQKYTVPMDGATQRQKMSQPKRKDHWRITFTGFAIDDDLVLGEDASQIVADSKFITLDVQSVGLPEVSYEKHEVHSYNSKMYYKGKYTWAPIDVTVRDGLDNNAVQTVYKQLQREFNHEDQSARPSPADYKFEMKIEQLDGTQSADGSAGVLQTWECYGCLIESAQFGDGLDYTSSDFITFSFSVQPDSCLLKFDENTDDRRSL